MQLQQPFNANQYDPTQGGGAQLTVGKHPVKIVESEIKPTSDNESGLVEFTVEVLDGPLKGTRAPYRLNLYNKNPQAAEIAHRQLSALSHVVNVFQFTDTNALHNIPFIVEVGLQRGEEAAAKGYTQINKVYDINGNEPGKPPANTQQQQPAQQGNQQQTQQNNTGWNNQGGNTGDNGQGNNTGSWGAGNNQQQQPNQQQGNNGGNQWQQNNTGGNGGGDTNAKPAWANKS